jgi:hypothetical protein
MILTPRRWVRGLALTQLTSCLVASAYTLVRLAHVAA